MFRQKNGKTAKKSAATPKSPQGKTALGESNRIATEEDAPRNRKTVRSILIIKLADKIPETSENSENPENSQLAA